MPAAQVSDQNAGLVLLQNPEDLLFRKAAALHALVLVVGRSELSTWIKLVGKANAAALEDFNLFEFKYLNYWLRTFADCCNKLSFISYIEGAA